MIPTCSPLGQIGGKDAGLTVRVKDFELLAPPAKEGDESSGVAVTASSDGSIRIWNIQRSDLRRGSPVANNTSDHLQLEKQNTNGEQTHIKSLNNPLIHQCGTLLGTYETGNRITCLKAFVMLKPSRSQGTVADSIDSDEFEGISDSDKENNS